MSAGGVFQLITNDGKCDRMLMATTILEKRVEEIACVRSARGLDPTPHLADLERTHILHFNAHFKPFAAMAFEYNKVKPQSGNPQLGNEITFSIPQFGDFFHDMVGRQVLSAFWSSEITLPTQKAPNATGESGAFGTTAMWPADGKDWDNTSDLSYSSYILVNPFGGAISTAYRNLVRYCEYPGERLYSKVQFQVNGNPLDEYNDDTVSMLRKFTLSKDKEEGYKRMVGQEVAVEGHGQLCRSRIVDTHKTKPSTNELSLSPGLGGVVGGTVTETAGATAGLAALNTPADYLKTHFPQNTHLLSATGAAAPAHNNAPLYLDLSRPCIRAARGPQTPKYWQAPLEVWNPLCFWFNRDFRLSIPSVSIPFGQRFITITLAAQSQIAYEYPGAFVQQHVTNPDGSDNGLFMVRYRPYWVAGTVSDISLSNVELYVNNIFVIADVHDIYIRRVGFSLIRVYRRHTQSSVDSATGQGAEIQLTSLKWPVEYMFVGFQPGWNRNSSNPNAHRDWHRYGKVVDMQCEDVIGVRIPSFYISTMTTEAEDRPFYDEDSYGAFSSTSKITPDSYVVELPVVTTLSLTAHGVSINDSFPESFFNSYVPFHYGQSRIVTPNDRGVFMFNFAAHPGTLQPSGHINLSRAREFFLKWVSSYVSSVTTIVCTVIAVCINFLLISDGSAVLRYST